MTLDHSKPIWVENESRAIGKIRVPAGFWNKMKNAPLINIEIDDEDRVAHLVSLYAGAGKDNELIEAFSRIESKLGGLAYRNAVQAVSNRDYAAAARIALKYYDKTYDYNLSINKAPRIFRLRIDTRSPSAAARELIGFCQSNTIFDLVQEVNGI